MLIGCVNAFNEGASLRRCLFSLRKVVDYIVLVDGAYDLFPSDVPYSTDGTLAIAAEFADEVIETTAPWQSEIVKRNEYLVGKPGDYYLVVDADEEVIGSMPTLENEDYQVMLKRTDPVPAYVVYRLFAHRPSIRYHGTHHALFVGNELLNKRKIPVVNGLSLIHHMDRPQERVEAKGEYYRHLKEAEAAFRAEHRL